MTDLEFQLQNEISEQRATINALKAEIRQRGEANNLLTKMFNNCQKQLRDALEREEIAKKVIADQRKEIYELRGKE
jgi:uncharacterized membrane-anchored protein YjiN (DUF445 family)